MELDPQCRTILDWIAENGSPFDTDDASEARRLIAKMTKPLPENDKRFLEIHDGSLPGEGGSIGYRYYRPLKASELDAPCLIYYHGGGMVFGDLNSHDPICRTTAIEANCIVISVDYRLAPEHKFPAAVIDAWSAFNWVIEYSACFGVDAEKIAVGGDSAGGNLATVVSLMARDREGLQPCLQWLIYPNTDMTHPRSAPPGGSINRFANDYFLTKHGLIWIQEQYLKSDEDRLDWRASPIKSLNLKGVAPAFIQTAGFDPLKDEGIAYALRLKEAGVKLEMIDYPGMIHGFIRGIGVLDVARMAIDDGVAASKSAFATQL